MCGIAGYYSKSNSFDENTLQFFTKTQHHRGPDSHGYYIEGSIGLAHNRLSILDASSNANQPLTSACGRYVIVYNGEVYNFRELASRIDVELRTSSDTEVVLELFAKLGKKCVEHFRGMYAMAIYDRQKRTIIIIRDRLGIKPLYYYQDKENFVFASELKAIAELPFIKKRLTINEEAACHYLHLGFIPSPHSIFNEVKKFPSGSVGEINIDGNLELWEYWNPTSFTQNNDLGYYESKKIIKDLLFQSVEEHLISDVPVGLFLSGGIDSSLLAAIANQIQPGKIKTFTIGFENSPHDEAPFAKKIAQHIGTEHYEAYITDNDIIRLLGKMKETYDEPFGDTSAIPTMFVSELASKQVKVVLSGEGADELFLSYGSYKWAKRMDNKFFKLAKIPANILNSICHDRKLTKIARILSKAGTTYSAANIYSTEHNFFTSKEISKIKNRNYNGFSFSLEKSSLNDQAFFELEVALKDGLLVKMDRATMKYGLEARVPYLDHRLVEFVLRLDLNQKLNSNKSILKEILFELTPKKYFERSKWGFGLLENKTIKTFILNETIKGKNQEMSFYNLFTLYHQHD